MDILKNNKIVIIFSVSLVFVILIAIILFTYLADKKHLDDIYNDESITDSTPTPLIEKNKIIETKQHAKKESKKDAKKDAKKESKKDAKKDSKKDSKKGSNKDVKKDSNKDVKKKEKFENDLFFSIGVKSIQSLNMLVDIFTKLVTTLGGKVPNKCKGVIDKENVELIRELFYNRFNQDYLETARKYNKYLDYYILVLDELNDHVNKGNTNLSKFNAMFLLKSRKTINLIFGENVNTNEIQTDIQKMIKDICAINGCEIIENKL